MPIKFGPAGIGSVKDVAETFARYKALRLEAAEIPFTYGIFIRPEQATKVKMAAMKNGIELSIHAPYWINLNSKEKRKIEESKQRILNCCEIGEMLGVKKVVFHAGFYGGMEKEETYQNIKKEIIEIMEEIKKKKWKIKLAPETMGKINVFGDASEILRLVDEAGCSFCLDFAHLWAREKGQMSYEKIFEKFNLLNNFHCHFSGIDFGDKGEKNHKLTSEKEWKSLLNTISNKDKELVLINESPDPIGDSLLGRKSYEKLSFRR